MVTGHNNSPLLISSVMSPFQTVLFRIFFFGYNYHDITEALEGHFYLLLITYYLLLITYYLLLITYYLSLITYYLLLIISFITPITAGNSKYTFPVTAVAVVVVVVVVVVAVYL